MIGLTWLVKLLPGQRYWAVLYWTLTVDRAFSYWWRLGMFVSDKVLQTMLTEQIPETRKFFDIKNQA